MQQIYDLKEHGRLIMYYLHGDEDLVTAAC